MSPAEVALWMARVAELTPSIIEMWNVIMSDTPQPERELAAAMELVRATKAVKAKEELNNP